VLESRARSSQQAGKLVAQTTAIFNLVLSQTSWFTRAALIDEQAARAHHVCEAAASAGGAGGGGAATRRRIAALTTALSRLQ